MCKIFKKYRNEILKYCNDNNLDSKKIFKSAKSYNNELVFVQHYDPSEPIVFGENWRDDIPAPITLKMFAKDNKLEFEQTEYTHKYLSV